MSALQENGTISEFQTHMKCLSKGVGGGHMLQGRPLPCPVFLSHPGTLGFYSILSAVGKFGSPRGPSMTHNLVHGCRLHAPLLLLGDATRGSDVPHYGCTPSNTRDQHEHRRSGATSDTVVRFIEWCVHASESCVHASLSTFFSCTLVLLQEQKHSSAPFPASLLVSPEVIFHPSFQLCMR